MEKILHFLETKKWLALSIVLVLTFLSYSNILANGFVWDDPDFYGNWPALYSLDSVGSLLGGELPAQHQGVYRPLRSIFQLFIFQLFGGQNQLIETGHVENAFGYHLISLLIHLAAVVAVYLLIEQLTKNRHVAFLSSLFFGLHPIHTEAISFFTTSVDIIGAVFFLYAVYFYLKSNSARIQNFYLTSIIFGWLAFFSYEFTLVLPLMLILLDLYKNNFEYRVMAKKIKNYIPYFVGVVVWIIIRASLPIASRAFDAEQQSGLITRVFNTSKAFIKYIYLLFIPYPQTVYHEIKINQNLADPKIIISIILLLALFGLAIYLAKRKPLISLVIGWFFLSLAAVTNVFPTGIIMAEKYTYLASVGTCLLMGWLVYNLLKSTKKYLVVGGVLLIITITFSYAGLTFARNFDWKSDKTLWQKTLASRPDYGRVHNNIGYLYAKEKNYNEALPHLEKAKALEPNLAIVYENLATVYDELGEYKLAIEHYQQAIKLQPNIAETYNNFGVTYQKLGQLEQALEQYEKAVTVEPRYYLAYSNAGVINLLQSDFEAAKDNFEAALKINPNFGRGHHGLAVSLVNLQSIDEAIKHYYQSIALSPTLIDNYSHLASIYSRQNEPQQAISILRQGIEAVPDDPELRTNLAVMFANQGDLAAAVEEIKKALELDPKFEPALEVLGQLQKATK
ncbi:MAG: tetratricopeptide repeat protein [Candidatus Buchananbacteria bacterium]|nr:tetratricopeptide repeat protein [Candidatus Buchananbacteria bacterium]